MDVTQILYNGLPPSSISFLFVFLYIRRYRIFEFVKKYTNVHQDRMFTLLAKNFRMDFRKPLLFIALPLLITLSIDIAVYILFRVWPISYGESLLFELSVRGIFNPISEEIIIRGFVFGAFLLTIPILIKKDTKPFSYRSGFIYWMLIALLLQTVLFAIVHGQQTQIELFVRTISGLLYGILYLSYGRNLIPSISAHIIHNIFIIFLNLSLI